MFDLSAIAAMLGIEVAHFTGPFERLGEALLAYRPNDRILHTKAERDAYRNVLDEITVALDDLVQAACSHLPMLPPEGRELLNMFGDRVITLLEQARQLADLQEALPGDAGDVGRPSSASPPISLPSRPGEPVASLVDWTCSGCGTVHAHALLPLAYSKLPPCAHCGRVHDIASDDPIQMPKAFHDRTVTAGDLAELLER